MKKLSVLAIFAVAFALLEAAVVVYLRMVFYPEGFTFPLRIIPANVALVELSREAATLVMLLTAALLAGKGLYRAGSYFIFTFGVWDIFYYIWLYVFLGWPAGPGDWDVLFLIPVPWVGPVWTPVAVSIFWIAVSVLLNRRLDRGARFRFRWYEVTAFVGASGLILYSWMAQSGGILKGAMPGPYPWGWFLAGMLAASGGAVSFFSRCENTEKP